MKYLITILLLLGVSLNSYSNCTCQCINGEVQPICSNSMDLPPMCSNQMCPVTPMSIQPQTPITTQIPMGTTSCQNEQVYNSYTRQYEWKMICR